MSEARLLEYLAGYHIRCRSLAEAIDSEPDRTFEILSSAAYSNSQWFTDDVVAVLLGRFDLSPRSVFSVLHAIAASQRDRSPRMMDHFRDYFARHPSDAIDALYYVCTNDPALLRREHVALLCRNSPRNPYQAFSALQHVLLKRSELINQAVVDSVLTHLHRAVNQAFYFIREAVKLRPEFVPACTLALFECVLKEPHPFVKREMIKDIVSIATHSHVKTGLEKALRDPPGGGTAQARALMAILFRQRFRVRQRVLLDSLDLAASYPAIWDFMLFLLDRPDLKQTTSAAAEDFLETTYRLSLLVSKTEFEQIVANRLDLREPRPVEFPEDVSFLGKDPDLLMLYRRVSMLATRLGTDLELTPVDFFRGRMAATQRERDALVKVRGDATTRRRRKLDARSAELARRADRWNDSTYRKAFTDAGTEAKLDDDARHALHVERKELAKKVADALHALAPQMTLAAIKAATMDSFRAAVRHVLGREYDLARIDVAVLPSFMYYERIAKFPKNRRYLARLIEDRLQGLPHDWMWTEPPVLEWRERVKAKHAAIRFDRWRVSYRREFSYHGANIEREKQQRIEHDLAQTRALFERIKIDVAGHAGYDDLRREYLEIRNKPPKDAEAVVLSEIETNLERIRLAQQSSDSDYEGKIILEVESDPFQVLFMGEYGFASCLSIRGSNVWSAVSNAVDVDKSVVWAKEPGGNIVGRRLIALAPEGIVSFRTYANRHGLALDGFFEKFLAEYAAHCGTVIAHGVKCGPLLSDQWYDDGAL